MRNTPSAVGASAVGGAMAVVAMELDAGGLAPSLDWQALAAKTVALSNTAVARRTRRACRGRIWGCVESMTVRESREGPGSAGVAGAEQRRRSRGPPSASLWPS